MPGAIGRRTLFGAVVAGVAAALTACGGDDGPTTGGTLPLFGGPVPQDGPAIDLSPAGAPGGRRVLMIGDSITVASTPALEVLARQLGIDLTIYAEIGRRITVGRQPAAGIDVLAEALNGEKPDLLVIALGTNDIGKYSTVEEYAGQIERFLALMPGDVPLVWINAYLSRSPDSSATFNAALLETLQGRGNTTIGRWSDIAQQDGVLSDGIHPTDHGSQRFADLVIDQIATWVI
jgi:lysophospholipase L1-like esterase